MEENSMRDNMKDGIREILAHYFKIDLLEVDADCVCGITDVAFSVCGISDKEQDEPHGRKKSAPLLLPDHLSKQNGKDLYRVQLEEINGEQEYSHGLLVRAETINEAWEKAKEHAMRWYHDEDVQLNTERGHPEYYFFGGAIAVRISQVCKTTKEAWLKRQYQSALINQEHAE